jgi:phosphoserine phosphatase RsbU/P
MLTTDEGTDEVADVNNTDVRRALLKTRALQSAPRLDVGSVTGRPLRLVLLIEDSTRDSEIIQHQFREAGAVCTFTVHRCLSNALHELRSGKGKFDLILLDLGLPDNNGLEALHHVRAAAPRIPTIVLTGRADEQLATEALHCGAQDYLVKGQHDPHMLLRAARHAIDRTETVELRETERLKSELLSIVSHEMRTPLTVIRENISLILEGVEVIRFRGQLIRLRYFLSSVLRSSFIFEEKIGCGRC